MQWLKRIRVVVALVFTLALTFLFLDFGTVVPTSVSTFFTSTQLIPSFIRTLLILSSAAWVLVFVIVMTILFGRVYCSTLCPLGIVQDVVIRLAKRINKRRRFHFQQQKYLLHYSLFFLIVLLALNGSVLVLNLLEPFSNYGRILTNLFSPSVVLVNNGLASLFEYFGSLILTRMPILYVNNASVLSALGFLVLIVYLAYRHGRLFCNLLCPAGAFLGLLSRYSIFKIVIDENNCKECGLCERICKAQCIQTSSKGIDFAACIGCFNCLGDCPTGGMSYQGRWKKQSTASRDVDKGRRTTMKTVILPALGFFLPRMQMERTRERGRNGFQESRLHPISPPGSLSVERFSSLCTACHLCVSSCPTQVLFPSFLEYGMTGIFQPKMNYEISYCNYDCVLCSQICPTGAILPLEEALKKEVQIGKVQFTRRDCIVVTKKTDCGACSEHCPTKAVTMVPFGEDLMIPETHEEICIGCGACEYACPAQPDKAIYVNTNSVHQKAMKPEYRKAEPSFDSTLEFPF